MKLNHIGGVMIRVLVTNMVDHGFEHGFRSKQRL